MPGNQDPTISQRLRDLAQERVAQRDASNSESAAARQAEAQRRNQKRQRLLDADRRLREAAAQDLPDIREHAQAAAEALREEDIPTDTTLMRRRQIPLVRKIGAVITLNKYTVNAWSLPGTTNYLGTDGELYGIGDDVPRSYSDVQPDAISNAHVLRDDELKGGIDNWDALFVAIVQRQTN